MIYLTVIFQGRPYLTLLLLNMTPQVFPPDDGLHRPSSDRGRPGGGQLLHGTLQVLQCRHRLLDDQTQHVAGQGELVSQSLLSLLELILLVSN